MKKFSLISILVLWSFILRGQDLEIHHIDVGQGDATLIKSPNGTTMLIDAGNNGYGTSVVIPYLTSLGVSSLNYLVCSHYHADHLGGLDEVIYGLGTANIGSVYDRGNTAPLPTTTSYSDYVKAANATGRRYSVTLGQTIDIGGDVSITCVATNGYVFNYGQVSNATSSENDLSIGWVLTYRSFRYFTGGDLGGETTYYADSETSLGPRVGKVNVMKVNHHGSRYSTNQSFLSNLLPEVAVISVGDGNTYGHPTQATIDRLVNVNCYIYQTETGTGGTIPSGKGTIANGTIVVRSSGSGYTVSYGTTTVNHPLSVELVTFTGIVKNSVAILRWSTATEKNNYGFEIERKSLASVTPIWEKIGFVQGNGTSNIPHSYSFTDDAVSPGKYLYRLKQIDTDGATQCSAETEVSIEPPSQWLLSQNYPNPFNPKTTITYSVGTSSFVTLKIYDILGREVETLVNEVKEKGTYTTSWNAENVPSGIYFCRLLADSYSATRAMIVAK